MIIVRPLSFSNTIEVLPRYYDDLSVADTTIEIINEDTREEITNPIITNNSKSDGFYSFDINVSWIENSTYRLKIYNTNSLLVYFRGKIFATQQTEQNYSLNG